MSPNKKTAIIVGVLFITATVTYMLGSGYLEPILNAPDYLVNVSANENLVMIGMLLELVNHVAVVCIPFMMFPLFKKRNEALALGYVVFRIIESVTLIVGSVSLLSLLTLSQEFVKAGVSDASYFLTFGTLLLAARDWTILLGVNIVFPLGALIFNYYLYQSKLIPRWLSGWGLIGAILLLARGLLMIFSYNPGVILTLPIWVQEMAFAVWLIVKGFNPSEIASGYANTEANESAGLAPEEE
ncbi:MAG: DUF4386 domain-containing protein [Candidatus Hermodarchaeia archaeon]|jgi:hypothetical protein